MMGQPSPDRARHVILLVWDSHRPDMADARRTPHLARLAARGVRFAEHHAVFPTSTCPNLASLVTGAYPAAHGLPANSLWAPAMDPARSFSTLTYDAVHRFDARTGGRLVLRETLTQALRTGNRRTAILSTDASGPGFVLDHREAGLFIGLFDDVRRILPPALAAEVLPRYAEIPAAVPNSAQNAYLTDLFVERILPQERPALSVLWYCDPDLTQHRMGIGSPESWGAVESNDANLGRVLDALDALGLSEQTDVLVTSDHGASTIARKIDLAAELMAAGLKAGPDSTDVIVASDGGAAQVYLPGREPARANAIVRFLQDQPWTGPIFTRGEGRDGAVPGTCPLALVGQDGPRAGDILFAFAWSPEANAHGIGGLSAAETRYALGGATHGGLGASDLRCTLVAAGPDFKAGLESRLPSGIIDLAPTILAILGLPAPGPVDGRVLREALAGGPDPASVLVDRRVVEPTAAGGPAGRRQAVEIAEVDGARYVLGGRVSA